VRRRLLVSTLVVAVTAVLLLGAGAAGITYLIGILVVHVTG